MGRFGESTSRQNCENYAEKFAQLEKAWKYLPIATLANLVALMRLRCEAKAEARGMVTNYWLYYDNMSLSLVSVIFIDP